MTLSDCYFVLANGNSNPAHCAPREATAAGTHDNAATATATAPRGESEVNVVQVLLRPTAADANSRRLRDHTLDLARLPSVPGPVPRGCLWRFAADGCIVSALSPALNADPAPGHEGACAVLVTVM